MSLGLVGIFVSLALLIFLAYRGHSVIAIAPIAALVALLFSGAPLLASYTQIFMPALANFIGSYFPLFLTGAIFGRLMSVSGYAEGFAKWISRILGPKQAILVTVLASALLTYGGVSAWVVVFTVFPIATSLFREADIPRRLMPAAIAAGFLTFALGALPGSPQVHNTIPTRFFGTTTFAAPIIGLIAAVVVFGLSMLYLTWRERKLKAAGESFSDPTEMERRGEAPLAPVDVEDELREDEGVHHGDVPHFTVPNTTLGGLISILPVVIVVAANALMTYVVIPAMNTSYLSEDKYGNIEVSKVAGIWAVTVAMLVAILFIIAMRPKAFTTYAKQLSEGAKNAVLPIFTTASEVGYGAIIASLAAFAIIRDNLFGIAENALVTSAMSTAVISGVTGSASGGMTIALNAFGEDLAALAQSQGIDMEVMHRITSMASTSFDSLPHNGAVITLLLVTGLTHRESYKDVGVITVIIPLAGVITIGVLGTLFGAF